MFCCVDKDENIIAIHDDIEVVESYVDSIYDYHKINLKIAKVRKHAKEKIESIYDDLYLVRYGDTYVQAGYILYLQLSYDQGRHDNKFARDILMKILETTRLTKKEAKQIEKAVEIVDRILEEDDAYTPSFSELSKLKAEYDPYIYNTGLYTLL